MSPSSKRLNRLERKASRVRTGPDGRVEIPDLETLRAMPEEDLIRLHRELLRSECLERPDRELIERLGKLPIDVFLWLHEQAIEHGRESLLGLSNAELIEAHKAYVEGLSGWAPSNAD